MQDSLLHLKGFHVNLLTKHNVAEHHVFQQSSNTMLKFFRRKGKTGVLVQEVFIRARRLNRRKPAFNWDQSSKTLSVYTACFCSTSFVYLWTFPRCRLCPFIFLIIQSYTYWSCWSELLCCRFSQNLFVSWLFVYYIRKPFLRWLVRTFSIYPAFALRNNLPLEAPYAWCLS